MPDLQHYASVNNKTDLVLSDIDLSYLISQFPSLQYDGESISYDGEIPFYIKSHNGANVISIDLSTDYGMPNQATLVPVVFTKKWLNLSFLNLRGQIEASLPLEYKSIFGDAPGVIDQSTIRGVLSEYFTYAPRIIIYTFFPILTCFLFAVAILQNLPTILILLFVSLFFYKNVSWKGCACIVIFSAASLTIAQSLIFLIAPVLLGQKWILGLWVNFLVVIGFFKALKFTKSSALI